jgi:hypothetical protein
MNRTQPGTPIDHHRVAEDLALDALLAIEHSWKEANGDRELIRDIWGEGPSRLRLEDLGLDTRLRSRTLVGTCPLHGTFANEWTGLVGERPPDVARCPDTSAGERCRLTVPATPDSELPR